MRKRECSGDWAEGKMDFKTVKPLGIDGLSGLTISEPNGQVCIPLLKSVFGCVLPQERHDTWQSDSCD